MLYDADRIEAGGERRRREGPLRGADGRSSSIPTIRDGDRPGAPRRRAGGLARGRAPLAGLEDGDGVEGRLPAASRIPHAADGLVRAAAVADPVGGRGRQDGHRRRHARRPLAAHSAALSRQPADGRRRGAGRARAGAHARHARLHAGQDRRRRDRRGHRRAGRPDGAADRGDVPHHGDRQLRGSLRHPDDASRDRRGRLRAARRLRLLASATAARRATAAATCSPAASSRPRTRWRSCDEDAQGPVRAADLSDRRAGRGGRRNPPRRRRRRRPAGGGARRAAPADRRPAERRSLRPAGALHPAVRPHALAVAASLRARAWREPRSRPGDGRSDQALRGRRLHADDERAAGFPAAVPGICLDAPAQARRSS